MPRSPATGGAWRGIYSVVSVAGFVLLVYGYGLARQASPIIWSPPTFMRHIPLLVILPVFPLLLAAYLPDRIQTAARHPMLLAVKFWVLAHLLANGTLLDVILFGAFLAWAVADRIAVKKRPVQHVVPARHGGLQMKRSQWSAVWFSMARSCSPYTVG